MAVAFWARHKVAVLVFAAMWGAIIWALIYFPTLGYVLCLRDGPVELKWTTIVGDAGIAAAYFWMPVRLVVIRLKIKVHPGTMLIGLFAAFILLCGPGTHGMKILMFWWPRYWLSAKVGLVTAGVSLMVAHALEIRDKQLVGLSTQAADLQAARDEADRLRKEAEARAIRAEGDVSELEQAQAALKAALAKAEREKIEADRLRRDAMESARVAEAARMQAEAAISEKQQVMRAVKDLSTPVLPVMDRILAMPLIGTLDSIRAEQAIESIMNGVADHQAEVLILDLTGVPVVDTQVADAILKAAAGVRLLGATCIITGIRPAVAQTIVTLGIDMATITTRSTLKAGLKAAMGMVAKAT